MFSEVIVFLSSSQPLVTKLVKHYFENKLAETLNLNLFLSVLGYHCVVMELECFCPTLAF